MLCQATEIKDAQLGPHYPALASALFGDRGNPRPGVVNPHILQITTSIVSNSWATWRTNINNDIARIERLSEQLDSRWVGE